MIPDFPNGALWLSTEPLRGVASSPAWGHDLLHSSLLILSILLIVAFLRDFFIVSVPVLRCMDTYKYNLELEHNIQLSRTRNRAAALVFLPLWLVADRFCILNESLWYSGLMLVAYLLLRRIMSWIMPLRRVGSECRNALRRILYTFSIPLCIVILLVVGVNALVGWDDTALRTVIIVIFGLNLAFVMLQEFRILNLRYHPFVSFLYLCGLEFVPASALVAAALWLA